MEIHAVIAQFDLQKAWLLHALQTISEEESESRIAENLNSIKWISGHVTDARMTLCSIVSGNPINENYKKHFGKGAPGQLDGSVPALEVIKSDWISISDELKTQLEHLPEEKLLSKPPFQVSIRDETLLGLIAYFAIHESFHIGQVSILRKLLGKQPMEMGR